MPRATARRGPRLRGDPDTLERVETQLERILRACDFEGDPATQRALERAGVGPAAAPHYALGRVEECAKVALAFLRGPGAGVSAHGLVAPGREGSRRGTR